MNDKTIKRIRKKTRVPGTNMPPRFSFTLRIEQSTHDRLEAMLKGSEMSRNDYISRLIDHDLSLREKLSVLNTPYPQKQHES
jgi:predicted HicB family RNase H-like nuclease